MIQSLRSVMTRFGWLDGSIYLLNRGFARLSIPLHATRLCYLAQPVPAEPLLAPRAGNRIKVRQVPPDHPALKALPVSEERLQARGLRQGTFCLAAFVGDNLAGCAWLTIGRHEDEQFRVSYQPLPEERAAWDYDVYVMPRYRYGFTFARLWDAMFALLREQDVHWTFSYVERSNRDSRHAHARLGAKPVGQAAFLRLGVWQIMMSSIPPRFHFSARSGSRPLVLLKKPSGEGADESF